VRPESERRLVAEVVAQGLNDCEIARSTGIPRPTIRDWRHGRFRRATRRRDGGCPTCGGEEQHGPGKKHQRDIVLTDWQQDIVDANHEAFLRGLIHSDGCRHINRVWRNGKPYEYSRYNFTNVSADIRALFCASCDALGIAWRRMNARNISVARREAVGLLDGFVGPKR
jgi:hypothetical protein